MRRVSRQLPVDPDDPTIQGRAQTSHSGPKCDLAGRAALGGKPTLSWTRTSQTGQRTKSLPSNPLRESKSREARNRSREDSDSAAAKIRHLNCRAVNLPGTELDWRAAEACFGELRRPPAARARLDHRHR